MNYLVHLGRKGNGDVVLVVAGGDATAVHVHPKGENRVLVVTDLDGTLVGHDDYLAKFKKHWTLNHLWRGSKLVSLFKCTLASQAVDTYIEAFVDNAAHTYVYVSLLLYVAFAFILCLSFLAFLPH